MSSIVRTATLSPEPVTRGDMKNFLKIPASTTADDALIDSLITAARIHAEVITECALVRATFVQYMDYLPSRGLHEFGHYRFAAHHHHGEIKIKRTPLVSVQSLSYIGTDGDQHSLSPGEDFIVDPASQPGRIRPVPGAAWPLTQRGMNTIAIAFTAGYGPGNVGVSVDGDQPTIVEPETVTPGFGPSWQPSSTQAQFNFLIDPNGNVEVQMNAGSQVTGAAQPSWPAPGSAIVDNGCLWQNFGPLRGFWTPDTEYSGNWVILDPNGNLELLIVPSVVSQTAPGPAWATTLGAATLDNGIAAWRCLGPYRALGEGAVPEQQAAYTIDWSLPQTVPMAIMQLVSHWYFNREPVAAGSAGEVPLHVLSLLATVAVPDYAPTPG